MKIRDIKIKNVLLIVSLLLSIIFFSSANAQDLRWLRVGQLQSFFMDYGSECELAAFNNNFFTWPTQYGDNQYTDRMKGLWFGAKDFYDPVEKKQKSFKVVGSGPRYDAANQPGMVFPESIKLIARSSPPVVVVDNQIGSNNTLYDLPDELDANLPCDRMIVIKFNTSMGISVTKKVMAFTQQNHENYFINDYVIKNTGIYNEAGDVYDQTLKDFWVYFSYRYAFAGITSSGYGSTWGAFSSEWGASTVYDDFGPFRNSDIRGFYAFYGPNKDRQDVTFDQDWGCPNQEVDGLIGAAKYAGGVTLFASKSPQEWSTDDLEQPKTTSYVAADATYMNAQVSQYDEIFMKQRYDIMSEGHLPQTHEESVGDQYIADWRSQHPDRDAGGGSMQGQGYGPYSLAPGDSIHIVFAEGVSGINWQKCREVGANWYAYYRGTGSPSLTMPNGSSTTNYTDYTRAWVETGVDSIMQTFRNAISNYNSGYDLPSAPSAPDRFTVESGGDKITLTWSDNAESSPHFNGYVIYRSEGNVKDYRTKYNKIFECDKSNVVNSFDDVTAARGFNYYYYIQSKDDGSQNDVHPGMPLYSSLFLTLTTSPAYLRRPAAPEHPIPPNSDSTNWKLTILRGVWNPDSVYSKYDRISNGGADYVFMDTSASTKGESFSLTKWKKITSKGEWKSGASYKAYDAVTYNSFEFVTPFSISGGAGLDLVRVVPNPYDIRGRFLQFGDQNQLDRLAFYGLPPVCKLKVFTERGDLIYEIDHTDGSGDELWDSTTSSGQIIVSGIYILYVETPDGRSVFRKFVVIR